MEDRLTRGFIAGVAAGILMNIWSYFSNVMNWTTLTMGDWAGIVIYGHVPPFSSGEYIFAVAGQILFAGVLGSVFAYLLPLVGSEHTLFKGWLFAAVVWFFVYAASTLFKVEGTVPLPLKTALSNFVAGSIYGLTLPAILTALTPEISLASRMATAPAMKPMLDEDSEEEP